MAEQKNHAGLISILLISIAILATVIVYFGVGKHQQKIPPKQIQVNGSYLTPPKQIKDFILTTHESKSLTKDNLKNHWTMMFFGFTNCGVVCPTTMAALNKMYLALQKELPADKLPQVILVSVDPERDTVSRLKDYISSFNKKFTGATGTPADLTALEKQLHILAIKVQNEGGDKNNYFYDHSAEILVINPNAEVQAYLSYPFKPEQLVKDYKIIIANS